MNPKGAAMNVNEIIDKFSQIEEQAKLANIKGYDFEQLKRIALRLESFSNCSECNALIEEFSILALELNINSLKLLTKKYVVLKGKALAHLQKEHKLAPKGFYTNLYLSIGMSFGLMIGVVFSQAIGQMAFMGLGIPIGLAIGISIGATADAKAKKDGTAI